MLKMLAQFRNRHPYRFGRQIGGAGHCENSGGEPPSFQSIGILLYGADDSLPIYALPVPTCF
jgi:hypothetical protein